MSYELSGSVKIVMDQVTFDSGFTKREFVVTTRDQYPQDVKFETVRDKTSLCDSLQPGMDVTVHFDIRGNEYKGRYFVNLNAWRVESGAAPAPASEAEAAPMDTDLPESAAEEEDYPF